MTAHISFPKIDINIATFSKFWLSEILRNKIHFQGVIFSDDLTMKGADSAGSIAQKIVQAFDAGCNIVLICNDRNAAIEALNFMEENTFLSSDDLNVLKPTQSILWDDLEKDPRRLSANNQINKILSSHI